MVNGAVQHFCWFVWPHCDKAGPVCQNFYPENKLIPQSRGDGGRLEMIFPRLSARMNEENIKIMTETLTLIEQRHFCCFILHEATRQN